MSVPERTCRVGDRVRRQHTGSVSPLRPTRQARYRPFGLVVDRGPPRDIPGCQWPNPGTMRRSPSDAPADWKLVELHRSSLAQPRLAVRLSVSEGTMRVILLLLAF